MTFDGYDELSIRPRLFGRAVVAVAVWIVERVWR